MPNRFHDLVESLSRQVEADYESAREHARARDPQRAGHEGESTWQRVISEWGPGWPVVTRKYVVGPGGDSNEIDVLLLKPDYPKHLRDQPSILTTGVAAAFSVKLTLRRHHLVEAIDQKKRLIAISGSAGHSVDRLLRGPFPFGLLAHSAEIPNPFQGAAEETTGMVQLYDAVAHDADEPVVQHPRDELDCVLVADRCFCSASRSSVMPAFPPNESDDFGIWSPSSGIWEHHPHSNLPGWQLVAFIAWLNRVCESEFREGALDALGDLFGTASATGTMRRWPQSVYPEYLLDHPRESLLDRTGAPILL